MYPYLTFLAESSTVTVRVCNNTYVGVEQFRIEVPEELMHITIAKSVQSL